MTVYFINWQADYELKMIDYLRENYKVINISVPAKYLWVAKKLKKIGISTNWLGKRFVRKYLQALKASDIALFNDSVISKGLTPQIIKNLGCKKILFLRNSVEQSFVEKQSDLFDFIYDFEVKENNNDKIRHLNQFFPVGLKEVTKLTLQEKRKGQTVCYFLGQDKNRLETLTVLASELNKFDVILDINIVRDKKTNAESVFIIDNPLSYNENLTRSLASDIIIDITKDDQSGWTLRVLESLYFNKKIITNNKSVMSSEAYSKERFFILGYNDWNQFDSFLQATTPPVSQDVLYKYSPDSMLDKIMADCK